ncbi:MAG: TIGR03936 family radical SAM-associated protein, partial [Treponema sp.]|nr:TIGR03936 family radical SAM-associated protein [Treponema sp.]
MSHSVQRRHARYVDPASDIGALLLDVAKPARYSGGEHGRLAKKDAPAQTLIAFPDLYEIGMSNQALKIIYNGLNSIPGISCDRAFAPAPDFEQLLKREGLSLYGLDTGIVLKDLDLLLFTLGYELGFSGILSMLDSSGIPLRNEMRDASDPVLIVGGPAVSNPLPYSNFIDAFWMGEAEAGFFDLAEELRDIICAAPSKAEGRKAMLEKLRAHPSIWMKGKDRAVRAIYAGFETASAPPPVYPVPSMKIVQMHAALEIMRGCPNGCRFCHAGYWYRPMRQKPRETLLREAGDYVSLGGYSEITLSSLSSGDYSGIESLVDGLNDLFSGRHVSFQLPSLKVSTFSLSLLEKISLTRKSGLTFAVETPLDFWQLALNKQVSEDYVVEILLEARRNGWRGAKFYFMIGLPLPQVNAEKKIREEEEIVNFINAVAKKTSMHFNINVGIFVPKPHTPYQWAKQLDSESAFSKLGFIRDKLKPRGHKVSVSETLLASIEGVLSRGDERAGDIAEEAFRLGSRLDAWNEYISKEAWRKALGENENVAQGFLEGRDTDAALPWQPIYSGVSLAHFREEFEKSEKGQMTEPCEDECSDSCGVCGKALCVRRNIDAPKIAADEPSAPEPEASQEVWRMVFTFSKEGSAVFHGHLSLIEIFSMSLIRAGQRALYTQGFNPLPKLEIVWPLSMGISAGAEIAGVDFPEKISAEDFVKKMNEALPEGMKVGRAEIFHIARGAKKRSLSSLLWGFGYGGSDGEIIYVPVAEDKAFREKNAPSAQSLFSLRRHCVLAREEAKANDA